MPVNRQVDCFKSSQSCPFDRVARHLKLLHHVLCRWTQDLVLDNCAVSFTMQSPMLKLKTCTAVRQAKVASVTILVISLPWGSVQLRNEVAVDDVTAVDMWGLCLALFVWSGQWGCAAWAVQENSGTVHTTILCQLCCAYLERNGPSAIYLRT